MDNKVATANDDVDESKPWLTFLVDNETYAVDALETQEVLQQNQVTPVPGAAPHILGVINVRGAIVTVVDARSVLGRPLVEVTEKTRIILIEAHDERQGLLVENAAVELAEDECKTDVDTRKLRRARAAIRRAELDAEYIASFAARVRELYPNCPIGREKVIAEHACRKYSGRVGRSAAAKELDKEAVCLAITAHVRHQETNYDELLLTGCARWQAREQVHAQVSHVLTEWQSTSS